MIVKILLCLLSVFVGLVFGGVALGIFHAPTSVGLIVWFVVAAVGCFFSIRGRR